MAKTSEETKLESRYVRTLLFLLGIVVFVIFLFYIAISRGIDFFIKVGERLLIRY
ncbi:MAG: hypothetical protein PVH45_02380 [Candidatus Omnitrophota bacterium]|jgi:hypothetical protein